MPRQAHQPPLPRQHEISPDDAQAEKKAMMESLAHPWGVGWVLLVWVFVNQGGVPVSVGPSLISGVALRIGVPDTTSSVRSPGRIRSAIAMNHDSIAQNPMTQCARHNTGRRGDKSANIGDLVTTSTTNYEPRRFGEYVARVRPTTWSGLMVTRPPMLGRSYR